MNASPAAPPVALSDRKQYENVAGHNIGVVTLNHENKPHAIPLAPGTRVWLSEYERRLTAQAPQDPNDNPFSNGNLAKVSDDLMTDSDARAIDAGTLPPPAEAPEAPAEGTTTPPAPETPPLAPTPPQAPAEETASPVQPTPDGTPAEGEYAEREEVATPDAAQAGGQTAEQTAALKARQGAALPADGKVREVEVKGTDAIAVPPPRPARPSDQG